MAKTHGYVGTIEVETRDTARIWFSLTENVDKSNWVEIGGKRAWFSLNLEHSDRPHYMAELSLLKDALRDGMQVSVAHEGARKPGKFDVTGVRILRKPMKF